MRRALRIEISSRTLVRDPPHSRGRLAVAATLADGASLRDRSIHRRRAGSVDHVARCAPVLSPFQRADGGHLPGRAARRLRLFGRLVTHRTTWTPREPARAGTGGDRQTYSSEAARALAEGAGPATRKLCSDAGPSQFNGLFSVGVALLLAIYFLLDGRRTYEWLLAFAPPRTRPRVRQTATEARLAALAYVRGDVATSAIAGSCTYIAMLLLHVPAALLLGVVAGILDFIPVLGVILSTFPAVLLGLTVSVWAAAGVVIFHAGYNVVENYYITPKVWAGAPAIGSRDHRLVCNGGGARWGDWGARVATDGGDVSRHRAHLARRTELGLRRSRRTRESRAAKSTETAA